MSYESETVYQEVIKQSEPLATGTPERESFYNEHGIVRTPLELIDHGRHNGIRAKDEGAQRIGAYKIRGAMWMVSQAVSMQESSDTALSEIHTVSTGNNGRAAGYAGRHFGLRSVVHAPDSITPEKATAIRSLGSELLVYSTFEEARQQAVSRGDYTGSLFLPPFDHYDIMSGQSSLGYELVEDLKSKGLADKHVDVVASVAGGGQISGYAIPIMQAKRSGELGENIRVIGVQPEGTDAMRRAIEFIRQGRPVPTELFEPGEFDTFCDALAIQRIGKYPTAIVADTEFVHDVKIIDRKNIAMAMHELFQKRGIWYEPAAALTYAYAKQQQTAERNKSFVLSLSGRNVSQAALHESRRILADDRWQQFQKDFQAPTSGRYDPVRESGENARSRAPQARKNAALGGPVIR